LGIKKFFSEKIGEFSLQIFITIIAAIIIAAFNLMQKNAENRILEVVSKDIEKERYMRRKLVKALVEAGYDLDDELITEANSKGKNETMFHSAFKRITDAYTSREHSVISKIELSYDAKQILNTAGNTKKSYPRKFVIHFTDQFVNSLNHPSAIYFQIIGPNGFLPSTPKTELLNGRVILYSSNVVIDSSRNTTSDSHSITFNAEDGGPGDYIINVFSDENKLIDKYQIKL